MFSRQIVHNLFHTSFHITNRPFRMVERNLTLAIFNSMSRALVDLNSTSVWMECSSFERNFFKNFLLRNPQFLICLSLVGNIWRRLQRKHRKKIIPDTSWLFTFHYFLLWLIHFEFSFFFSFSLLIPAALADFPLYLKDLLFSWLRHRKKKQKKQRSGIQRNLGENEIGNKSCWFPLIFRRVNEHLINSKTKYRNNLRAANDLKSVWKKIWKKQAK